MSPNEKIRPRRDVQSAQNQPPGHGDPQGGQLHLVHEGPQAAAEHPHPSPTVYIQVAVVLAVITGVEVAIYYVEAVRSLLVPILLLLSALKFALVVAFYMHLRFDSKLFRYLFVFAMFVAASILIALILLNAYHASTPGAGAV